MVKDGLMREHKATGPKGGAYKVLTLTECGVASGRNGYARGNKDSTKISRRRGPGL